MFARIGTWQGSPADLERWIVRGREQVKPAIRQDPGLSAVSGSSTGKRARG